MRSASSPVIEANDLTRSYGNIKAVSGVDLTVVTGEKVVLIGPNGSGKTTLIKLFSTLIKPTDGTLKIFGRDALKEGAQLRRSIGALLHEPLIYDRLTVWENLTFYSKMFQVTELEDRIDKLAQPLAIADLLRMRVGALSHGQRKRVSLLRTLLHDPPLLLLDEPDSGLDQGGLEALLRVVSAGNRTVVMSTHNFENGLNMAHRVIILVRGRAIMDFQKDGLDKSQLERRYGELVNA